MVGRDVDGDNCRRFRGWPAAVINRPGAEPRERERLFFFADRIKGMGGGGGTGRKHVHTHVCRRVSNDLVRLGRSWVLG